MTHWSTACLDWEERIVEGRSLIPFAPLFPQEAEAALDVFRGLRLVDVTGRPTMGEASRQWVFDFVSAIFGSYDAEAGRRLIQYYMLLISKKNTKSTTAAGVMVTALVRNWRDSGEYYILAPTKEIADNSYYPARDMIRADPELAALLRPKDNFRTIEHRTTGAFLKVVAADSETVGGKKTIGLLIDELWLFGKKPNAANILLEAMGGLASHPEGFVIYLSTQSDSVPAGVFAQKLQEFREIRDGVIVDPGSLPVLYEYPKALIDQEAYKDPKYWYVTNPNLGASVDERYLSEQFAKAERAGRPEIIGFLAKHLNVEIGLSLRGDRWAGAKYWERRADPSLTLGQLLDRCEVVVVGIDGGGLDDLFGLAVLGREKVETEAVIEVEGVETVKRIKRWLCWSHAWCDRDVLDERKSIAPLLLDFEKAGELTIVDDALADLSAIIAHIEAIKDRGLLAEVGVDPAGLGELVDALDAIGVTEDNGLLVGVGQGYRMMNAIKTAERRLKNGTLLHGVSKLMDWCVGNVKIEPTATAIRATKQNAGDAKIDPWAALMNAVDRMSLNPGAGGIKTIYGDGRALRFAA
jgi:phage terminase large subunit-like protein